MSKEDFRVEGTDDGTRVALLKGEKLVETFDLNDAQIVGQKLTVMGAFMDGLRRAEERK